MSTEEKSIVSIKEAASVLSLIEKPWLLVWTLRIIIITIFLDIALIITGQKGS